MCFTMTRCSACGSLTGVGTGCREWGAGNGEWGWGVGVGSGGASGSRWAIMFPSVISDFSLQIDHHEVKK